jgi:hypothetical protein
MAMCLLQPLSGFRRPMVPEGPDRAPSFIERPLYFDPSLGSPPSDVAPAVAPPSNEG